MDWLSVPRTGLGHTTVGGKKDLYFAIAKAATPEQNPRDGRAGWNMKGLPIFKDWGFQQYSHFRTRLPTVLPGPRPYGAMLGSGFSAGLIVADDVSPALGRPDGELVP